MKSLVPALFLILSLPCNAQYYYKDIIGNRHTSDLIKAYRINKVKHVVLTSYDADNTKMDDFVVEQQFSNDALTTITKSNITNESSLTSYIDVNGKVIKTVDSTEKVVSVTNYTYNGSGELASTLSSSSDSTNSANESEEHIWIYNQGKPVRMLRIKDKSDTTYVDFKLDANGNVSEEQETHKGLKSQPVYYYYDNNGRLTDIVRFNQRAKRLLADYMFEYSPSNQVIQQITVPANSSDYLIWRYQYDDKGLKIKEAVYNKKKQLNGMIEYQYSFGQ